jgi:hypothetical protein
MAARQGIYGTSATARWELALEKLYPTSPVARKKGAPRGAFLGLCEDGLVQGIPAGDYSASKLNKGYAVRAIALLLEGAQHWSKSALWQSVTDGSGKEENGQIDIVLALWNNNLIVGKPQAK